MNNIPEHLMKDLRQRLGLDPDDKSRDSEIMSRRAITNLEELCAWEFGDSSWADWFVGRMRGLGVGRLEDLTTIF